MNLLHILIIVGVVMIIPTAYAIDSYIIVTQDVGQITIPLLVENSAGTDLFWVSSTGEIFTVDDLNLRSGTGFVGTITHGISGAQTWTFPDLTGTVVLTTGAQTLTSKTLTNPVINTGVSGTAILDEDNMASNSDTKLATQQSIKAYVDSFAGTTYMETLANWTGSGCANGQIPKVSGATWSCASPSPGAARFLVYSDGVNYIAYDTSTNTIPYNSTNAANVINPAIQAMNNYEKIIVNADFTVTAPDTIAIYGIEGVQYEHNGVMTVSANTAGIVCGIAGLPQYHANIKFGQIVGANPANGWGLYLINCIQSTIEGGMINNIGTGIIFQNTGTSQANNDNWIRVDVMQSINGTAGIYFNGTAPVTSAEGQVITANIFGSSSPGVLIDSGAFMGHTTFLGVIDNLGSGGGDDYINNSSEGNLLLTKFLRKDSIKLSDNDIGFIQQGTIRDFISKNITATDTLQVDADRDGNNQFLVDSNSVDIDINDDGFLDYEFLSGSLNVKANSLKGTMGCADEDMLQYDSGTDVWDCVSPNIGVRVVNGSTATIPNVTFIVLKFDTESYDTDTMHDTSTNKERITIKTPGVYHVNACFSWDSNSAGTFRYVAIVLNGATVIGADLKQPINESMGCVGTLYNFALNDYIHVTVLQDSGAPRTITTTTTSFSAQKVS